MKKVRDFITGKVEYSHSEKCLYFKDNDVHEVFAALSIFYSKEENQQLGQFIASAINEKMEREKER